MKIGGTKDYLMMLKQGAGRKCDTFEEEHQIGREISMGTLPSSWMQGILHFFSLMLNE